MIRPDTGLDATTQGRKPRTRPRAPLWALVVIVAWAVVATGALGWILSTPAGPAPSDIWDSDGWLLAQLGWSTGSAGVALSSYLATHNQTAGADALNWTVQAESTVSYGQLHGPGGFPSSITLNLTVPVLLCTYTGLFVVIGHLNMDAAGWTDPSVNPYLRSIADAFQNVTGQLRFAAGGGTTEDPLASMGPARIASVRENATELFVLSQPFGQGISGSRCTTP